MDILVATPGRLLDLAGQGLVELKHLEVFVLDEADRMLDMGFIHDVRKVIRMLPRQRQTLFFSATMPREIATLAGEMLHRPATINLERKSAPAVGITQAVYPVPRELKSALLLELVRRDVVSEAIVFTRTKHRTNRLAEYLEKNGIDVARIHGNRSQGQRTAALEGFKAGKHRLLVATDIVARGIDVEALSHVINFDVPNVPEDYIHRVGRTARAEMTGDAFTFVSPEEQTDLAAIERAIGKRLPRITVPGFDYAKAPAERFEVPLAERIAQIRARKAEERLRAKQKAERRTAHESSSRGQGPRPSSPARPAQRPAGPGHRPAHAHRTSHGQPAQPSAGYGRRSR